MDPLTHLLTTRLLVGRSVPALVAGLVPDLPFYLSYPAWVAKHGLLRTAAQTNQWPEAPAWMLVPHRITHSLLIAFCVLALLRWPSWGKAWILHILIDIPTHEKGQWAPQALWPCSSASYDGVSWVSYLLKLLGTTRF